MSTTTVDDYETWAYRMGYAMLGPDIHPGTGMDWEDLAQVAMIEAWKATLAFDPERSPKEDAFVKWCARNAAKTALRERQKHIVHRNVDDAEDVMARMEAEDPSVIDQVIEGYHAGEIARALATLTPKQREYVHARFWMGMSQQELVAHFGYSPSGIWGGERGGVKRKLAAELAHLR